MLFRSGWRAAVIGSGRPAEWRVLMEDVPPLLAPLTDRAPVVTRRPVLSQVVADTTEDRFPVLVCEKETFGDFTFTTRFKLAGGTNDQMAGVIFRMQDEKNFYVIRASGLGGNLRFYKVVNGDRILMPAQAMEFPAGKWRELSVECKGNQIRCLIDGADAMPPVADTTFASGRLGFLTKSDSATYFADSKITYQPHVPLTTVLVEESLKKYPRLHGLRIVTLDDAGKPRVAASKNAAEVGTEGTATDRKTIADGTVYHGRSKGEVTVVMPLRDKNGDPMAAVRVVMESFAGETQDTALGRAMPIVKEMQARVMTLQDLYQ